MKTSTGSPSAVTPGFFETDLDLRLRELAIDHLIITGVVTNICVRSTAHDAFFRGYDVVIPVECVAATSDREQQSSLYDLDTHYGTVAGLDESWPILARAWRQPVITLANRGLPSA